MRITTSPTTLFEPDNDGAWGQPTPAPHAHPFLRRPESLFFSTRCLRPSGADPRARISQRHAKSRQAKSHCPATRKPLQPQHVQTPRWTLMDSRDSDLWTRAASHFSAAVSKPAQDGSSFGFCLSKTISPLDLAEPDRQPPSAMTEPPLYPHCGRPFVTVAKSIGWLFLGFWLKE